MEKPLAKRGRSINKYRGLTKAPSSFGSSFLHLFHRDRLVEFGHQGADKRIFQERAGGRPDPDAGIGVRAGNGDFRGQLVFDVISKDLRHAGDDGLPKHLQYILLPLLVPLKHIQVIEKDLYITFIIAIRRRDGGEQRKPAPRHVKFTIRPKKLFNDTRSTFVNPQAIW